MFLRFIAFFAFFGGWCFVPSAVLAQSQLQNQFSSLSQELRLRESKDTVSSSFIPQAQANQDLVLSQSQDNHELISSHTLANQDFAAGLGIEPSSEAVEQVHLQSLSFADLSRIKSIHDGPNVHSPEGWSVLSTITDIGSSDGLNNSGSPRTYTQYRLPRSITENNTPRDPNRIYRKRFFWGIAFSGTQAKMKMQLDPVFWQRNDSLINIRPQGQLGGGFGGSVAMRIMRQWELKMLTMLQLHNRNIDFDWKYTPTQTLKIETISLDIPLTLKYRSDMPNNTGFFVVGGVRWSHDFQSMEGTVIGASKPLVAIKEDTYYYEFGCGFEFRMEYVDMSIELKMSNGLNNALVRVPESYYSGSMSAIFPRLFSITLMAQN